LTQSKKEETETIGGEGRRRRTVAFLEATGLVEPVTFQRGYGGAGRGERDCDYVERYDERRR